MPTITLRKIDAANASAVSRLRVKDDQQTFVSPNGVSIVEAHYDPENFYVRAIYADETPIGLTLYGWDEDETRSYWIVRFMIDQNHQGKGYGRTSFGIIVDAVRNRPGCQDILISFNPLNDVARKLYASFGFVDTGRMEHGEQIYRLPAGVSIPKFEVTDHPSA
jgi:diamine N-acetyltransferase